MTCLLLSILFNLFSSQENTMYNYLLTRIFMRFSNTGFRGDFLEMKKNYVYKELVPKFTLIQFLNDCIQLNNLKMLLLDAVRRFLFPENLQLKFYSNEFLIKITRKWFVIPSIVTRGQLSKINTIVNSVVDYIWILYLIIFLSVNLLAINPLLRLIWFISVYKVW